MAYLILAHGEREHLEMLVERLAPPGSPDIAIVHADRRSALWTDLRRRWSEDTPNRKLIPDPVAVRWGHWSQVAATGRLIAAALAEDCDHAHLLSGADWPMVSRDQLAAQIAADPPGTCRIEAMAGELEERMQCRRLDSRWLRIDRDSDPYAYALCWELRRASYWLDRRLARAGIERSRPWGPWRKGSTWWSLPKDALALLGEELPPLLRSGRLRGTLCSDEHVIPTIIAAHFAEKLADNRRFILWTEGMSSPQTLASADLPAIRASDAWFMRKVSIAGDPFFLDLPG